MRAADDGVLPAWGSTDAEFLVPLLAHAARFSA
jgi:hypothetical protein